MKFQAFKDLFCFARNLPKNELDYQMRAFIFMARLIGTNTWENKWVLRRKLSNFFGMFVLAIGIVLVCINFPFIDNLEDIG